MIVESLLAVAGLVLLTFAADHLVFGSSRIAGRLRVSPVVVGVVVIGLGTSAPEFLVSDVAAARGDTGISIGNIVGSNILNLTLILGVAALVAVVGASTPVIRREVRLAVVEERREQPGQDAVAGDLGRSRLSDAPQADSTRRHRCRTVARSADLSTTEPATLSR